LPSRQRRRRLSSPPDEARRVGRLLAGTSGFAYPGWSPRFYPAGLPADGLLAWYASRFPTCELNNTFYQQPSPSKVAAWLVATPEHFRFAVKAQRGGARRSITGAADESVPWLTAPLREFGSRLGAVLLRVGAEIRADTGRLATLLEAWPRDLPLVLEFQDPSWRTDEVHERLATAGAVLCTTELPEDDTAPDLRVTGPFLYLRLRRHDYRPAEVDRWADRLVPFLADGLDAYAFFRHDESGRATELADELAGAVERRLGREGSERLAAW
jgi:uncharacterized protein YecE (DUF72 family)